MMNETRSFFEVPQTTHETSEGPVNLPILYYDTSYVFAFFLVSAQAAAAQLGDADLRPAMSWRGKTLVVLANYHYRNSTVGPYAEVGLAVPVVPRNARSGNRWLQAWCDPDRVRRDLGYHILHLPVTTEAANAAGRELWGLPKFVTDIDVHHRGRMIDVRVADPDSPDPIMTLQGRACMGVPAPQFPVMLYSRHERELLRTTVTGRGPSTLRLGGNVRVRLGAGDHPMVQTMRALGMDGLSPIGLQATHASQSRLNRGVPLHG